MLPVRRFTDSWITAQATLSSTATLCYYFENDNIQIFVIICVISTEYTASIQIMWLDSVNDTEVPCRK